MDKNSVKDIYEKLILIYEDCNDCRVWEIQNKLGDFLKWFSEGFKIKNNYTEWKKRKEELLKQPK